MNTRFVRSTMTGHAVIIGDGPLGERLARAFEADEAAPVLVSDEEAVVTSARAAGIETVQADPAEAATLDRSAVDDAESAIVATRDDGRSLLVTQLLRIRGTDRVVALVHDPRNLDAFADAGVDAVCATTVLTTALADRHAEDPRRESPADTETDRGSASDDERLRPDSGRSGGG